MQKGFSTILVIITGLLIIGGGIYYFSNTESQNNSNLEKYTQRYENKDFGYEINYSQDRFILDTVDNPVIESETRDIGELKLKEGYWSNYGSILQKPKVSWIVNLDEDSPSNECGYSTSLLNTKTETFSDKEWKVEEIVSGNDIGGAGNYYKKYYHKGEGRCFMLFTYMTLVKIEENNPEPLSEVLEIQKMLENVVKDFKVNEL